MNATGAAKSYYDAIDAGRYDDLAGLLATGFVHRRPDRTFEGREAFVGFMRDERPRTDTSHEIDGVYADRDGESNEEEVAVRGRLVGGDGDCLFGFVDVHTVADGAIARIHTYTD